MKESLIEEQRSVQNSKVGISLHVGNDLGLKEQEVRVGENHLVELLYIYYCFALFLAFSISLLDKKYKKSE